MGRPGVMLYFSILPALDSLPPASAGTLLLAAMHYAQDGKEPVFEDSTLSFAWSFMKPSIDRDSDVYEEKRLRGEWLTYCRQCKRDGNEPSDFETWRQRTVTEPLCTETGTIPISVSISNSMSVSDSVSMSDSVSVSNRSVEADKPPRSRFTPPSVSEIQAYCLERNSSVDPEQFFDYYTANGWKQGAGKAIKDWRACVRTWERRNKAAQTEQVGPAPKAKRYEIIDGEAVEVSDDE